MPKKKRQTDAIKRPKENRTPLLITGTGEIRSIEFGVQGNLVSSCETKNFNES